MTEEQKESIPESTKLTIKKPEKQRDYPKWLSAIITWTLTLVITTPVFIILYQYVPEIKLVIADKIELRLEYLLVFLTLFILFFWLIKLLRKIFIGLTIAFLIILTLNLFMNKYSYRDIYNDYRSLILYLIEEPVKVPFLPESANFRNAAKITNAITYDDPEIRNYAIVASLKHFSEDYYYRKYGNVVRYFSIFKEINTNWKYIPDPLDKEYYASANETIYHLSGDCDDHSIVMASLIKSIGGEVRLVRTIGHLYPEVKVCHRKDLEQINLLIRELFEKESEGKSIFFHLDKDGYVWLNFDYTDKYPGGKFMNIKIVDILT